VLERSSDSRQVRAQEPRGAGMPSIDERDLLAIDEQVRLSTDEPNDMHVW
jgi:hypothetical protein